VLSVCVRARVRECPFSIQEHPMHFIRIALLASIVTALSITACGGDSSTEDNDPFPTYQACFDEHHNTEGFDVQKAIVICCISHPIGSAEMNVVCGSDAASCETYVGSNLTGSDVGSADITAACTDYVNQRGM
jgi:hypothetical protein